MIRGKGKAAMEAQLAQGAVGSYNIAGKLGIGMIQANTEKHDALGTRVGPPSSSAWTRTRTT